jgi:hypothetical protein
MPASDRGALPPLEKGRVGVGIHRGLSMDPHPTACALLWRSTSPFQGEVGNVWHA